jgi:Na+-transporting methylmalonyl-CoA/oxaloacetate decarboxylase gamma subunit
MEFAAIDPESLVLALIGMCVVFAMLVLLVVVLFVMRRVLAPLDARSTEKKVAHAGGDDDGTPPPEVIALIAAALQQEIGEPVEIVSRVSLAHPAYAPSPWGRAGRQELMAARINRTKGGR